MDLKTRSEEVLRETFGFASFRSGQREIVEHILAGRSALAVFPTGGGKSLCYQLPALMLQGTALVVSPLIALMKDQIDFLIDRGVAAARLDSSQTAEETRQVWSALASGELKLLYVAPERFASERFLHRLRETAIGMMVIDEAHCISEWGHNFRPDYMKLANVARELKLAPVLALTATATPPVAKDICRAFGIADDAYVNTGFYRPNLTIRVTSCTLDARDALLLERLNTRSRGATIVYVTLQKTAERVAEFLTSNGLPARAYHAGMESTERHEVQDAFMSGSDPIVVATIAFGMGIDKEDIRYVYHYNPPKTLENYMQETGRAGRDGEPSTCEVLYCPEDVATLENFTYGDTPSLESVVGLVGELIAQPDHFDLSVHTLSSRYDIRPLVVSTLLTYLELDGVIAATGPFYNEYKFQPLRNSKEILAKFDSDRSAFLKRLLARSKKGVTWFSIDLRGAAAVLGEPRARLVSALNYLEEQGDLKLQVAGLRQGYRFRKRPEDPEAHARALYNRFEEAERRDIARIAAVSNLARSSECLVRQLLEYFGDPLESDCGHCDRCLGEALPTIPATGAGALNDSECEVLRALVSEAHTALATPRQMARFLCGITSPATTRARLTKDPRFGTLSHLRFATVTKAAEAALPDVTRR